MSKMISSVGNANPYTFFSVLAWSYFVNAFVANDKKIVSDKSILLL